MITSRRGFSRSRVASGLQSGYSLIKLSLAQLQCHKSLLYTSGLQLVIVLPNSYIISYPLGNPSFPVSVCTVIARSLIWVKLLEQFISHHSQQFPMELQVGRLLHSQSVSYLCCNPSRLVVPYSYHQANKLTTLQQLDSNTHPSQTHHRSSFFITMKHMATINGIEEKIIACLDNVPLFQIQRCIFFSFLFFSYHSLTLIRFAN